MKEIKQEGIRLKKTIESERLIDQLTTLIDMTPQEVGQRCAYIYSMETFLYSQLNQFLREEDLTKIEIYKSFVRLLFLYFDDPSSIEVHSIEVYRGMNLTPTMIDAYKEAMNSNRSFRWAAFSSTSRNRALVEKIGTNTIFVMKLNKIYCEKKKSIDISNHSQYPAEEEVLLQAGVEFIVKNIQYNAENKKNYIYLEVYV